MGLASPEAHLRVSTLEANLLGDGGVVVLQDEPLDMVSPAPFLLHCLGLGGGRGAQGEGTGFIILGQNDLSTASLSTGGGGGGRRALRGHRHTSERYP